MVGFCELLGLPGVQKIILGVIHDYSGVTAGSNGL